MIHNHQNRQVGSHSKSEMAEKWRSLRPEKIEESRQRAEELSSIHWKFLLKSRSVFLFSASIYLQGNIAEELILMGNW